MSKLTRYILIGGYPRGAADGGKGFAMELTEGFADPIKILDCPFARPESTWKDVFTEDRAFLATNLPDRQLDLVLANPEQFSEQVATADAIYFRGGRTNELIRLLNLSPGWHDHISGKTVAGTSAGADAIAKYYYDLDHPGVKEGLGLLPLKVIVHWRSDYNSPNIDWDKAYTDIQAYKEDLPIVTLAEGEFKIFNN